MNNAMRFAITCPLDSDLSVGYCYPPFIQLGPQVFAFFYSAHSFSPVLCRGKSAAVMVNLTYVVLLVG